MTYNRHTKRYECDICAASKSQSPLYLYYSTAVGYYHNPASYLCQNCINGGAYWCVTCQAIHAPGEDCSQKNFLNSLQDPDSDNVAFLT